MHVCILRAEHYPWYAGIQFMDQTILYTDFCSKAMGIFRCTEQSIPCTSCRSRIASVMAHQYVLQHCYVRASLAWSSDRAGKLHPQCHALLSLYRGGRLHNDITHPWSCPICVMGHDRVYRCSAYPASFVGTIPTACL